MKSPLSHAFLFLILFTKHAFLFSQVQIGMDIDGEHAGDASGWSLSLSADGKRVAIGGYYNSDGAHYAGHVRVFDLVEEEWLQAGHDLDGTNIDGHFGGAIALSDNGNVIAIGEYSAPSGSYAPGLVRIYEWSENQWQQKGDDITGSGNERCGFSIALSANGNRVAIGVPDARSINNNFSGVARVFDFVDTSWAQVGTEIPGQASGDEFGASIALSDDGLKLVVGADWNDGNGDYSGHVRTYKFNGVSWVKTGTDLLGEAQQNRFGQSLSLNGSGDRLIVGAFANDGNGNASGHARVFKLSGNNWAQMGPDLDGDGELNQFGTGVAISSDGNTVAVGQPGYYQHGNSYGLVRLFRWNGNAWTPFNNDIHGESDGDASGTEISLSGDGSVIAISGFTNDGNGNRSGHVRVYNTEEHPTSTFSIFQPTIHVYPIPAYDRIYLEGLTSETVQIEDQSGKNISSQIYSENGIDISSLPSGIYSCKIISKVRILTGIFLKI